ncbi:hypothetical protein KAU11_00385 [Candidatus Babeliales bacterium]|nr:hypothetical protein [Candidatus Babeliales bacterium]
MYTFMNFYIPDYMMQSIQLYVEQRIKPGSFLCAVICNNLGDAVGQADNININNLPAYAAYFYNEVPSLCWGSKEKMDAWIKGGKDE